MIFETYNSSAIEISFFLGILAQIFLLVKNSQRSTKWFTVSLVSILSLAILGALNFFEVPGFFIVFSFYLLFFILSISALFGVRNLPAVSRKTIATFSVVFWFLYFKNFINTESQISLVFLYAFLIFTVCSLILVWGNWPIRRFYMRLNYIWFLFMFLFVSIYQIYFSNIFSEIILNETSLGWFDLFLFGMSFVYISVMVASAALLLPFQFFHPRVSTQGAVNFWERQGKLIESKYLNEPHLVPFEILLVLLAFCAVLYINYKFKFVSDFTLINIMILVSLYYSKQEE